MPEGCKLMKLVFIICFLLLNNSTWATERKKAAPAPESPQAFGDPAYWQSQIRFTRGNLKELYPDLELDSGTLGSLRWKKCGSSDKCYLTECDVRIPNCHGDRILLFRGEGAFPKVGVSAAVRHQLAEPRYCGGNCTGLRLLDLLR